MHHLRFRQVHLDFHTSPDIPGIGEAFDREKWQRQLRDAHVDSITCFAICHHGWSYHPTKVGEMHPHLKFDLLRAQFDACKQIDVNVPVYITAGFNQRVPLVEVDFDAVRAAGFDPTVFVIVCERSENSTLREHASAAPSSVRRASARCPRSCL